MNDRAVTDVIGYILVFSLVASIIAIVSITGMNTLTSVKSGEQVRNAERAFDVLDDNLNDVHREGAPSRATEISLQNARIETSNTATINVSGWSGSGTNFTVNRTVNTIVWEGDGDDETQIVYAFGAVIRDQEEGGFVVNRPPFQFDDHRTILPIVRTDAESPGSFSGTTVRVRGERGTTRIATTGDATAYTNLWLNITTVRADVWKGYLDEQPGTSCDVASGPGEKDIVECELTTPDELSVALYPIEIDVER